MKTKSFTLIELIVVVAIISVLAVISTLSLSEWLGKSRDSKRIGDISQIEKALDLSSISTNSYPTPDNYTIGTIDGTSVLYNGFLDSGAVSKTSIKSVPKDPKTDLPYPYSLSSDGKFYQVSAALENGTKISYLQNQTYAATPLATVKGNYKGVLSYNTGSYYYIVNLPSLIFTSNSQTSTGTNLLANGVYFVVDKKENLPYSIGNGSTTNKDTTTLLREVTSSTTTQLTVVDISDYYNKSTPLDQILSSNMDALGGATILNITLNMAGATTNSTSTFCKISIGISYPTNDKLGGKETTLMGEGVVVDGNGNIYIADAYNRVKKYDKDGNRLMTIGTGKAGDNNLNGTAALLNLPKGIALDSSGNIYVVDTNNNKMKKYDPSGNWLMTIGSGITGDNNLNGTSAMFYLPFGVAVDNNGNIYISDSFNHKIKKYDKTGNWIATIGGFNYPGHLTVDTSGNLYVSGGNGHAIMKLDSNGNTLMTIGTLGVPGDNTSNGTSALIHANYGIAVDSAGNIYETEAANHKMKKYDSNGNYLMTIGGGGTNISGDNTLNGTDAKLNLPIGVAVDSAGNIYIAEQNNKKMKKYDSNGNYLMTIGGGIWDNNLGASSAKMRSPVGMSLDNNGNMYIADTANNKIKKYDASGNWLMTIGGGSSTTNDRGDNTSNGVSALLSSPTHVNIDNNGNIYVVDTGNRKIKKYDASGNWLMTIGDGTNADNNLNGTSAQFKNPYRIDIDSSGNMYIADSSANRIKKYDASGNFLMAIGDGTAADNNSNGTSAKIKSPLGVRVDSAGNIYVADRGNNKIKKYDPSGNWLMTIGDGTPGDNNMNGISAKLYFPTNVTVDSAGNIYVADSSNHKIKKYDASGNYISAIGGSSTSYGDNCLGGTNGLLYYPNDVAIDQKGYIYVVDTGNSKIKKYSP